jgi:hypothetical protein
MKCEIDPCYYHSEPNSDGICENAYCKYENTKNDCVSVN